MKKYAIFGNPVIHSKSPQIFGYLFEEYGQQNIYKRVKVNTAQEIIDFINQYDLSGANITSPFKETILPFLDKIDNVSKEVNSVNTIIKKGDKFYGFNTDVYGVENVIINNGLNVKNKKCIVIGAGGAAKASVYALKSLGASIYSVNRTDSKSMTISKYFKCNHILFEELDKNIQGAYLIVIAVTELSSDIKKKIKNTIVLNANYHQQNYEDKSLRIINGQDWLVNQASKAFEIFFDKIPNYLMMKKSLDKILPLPSNIALIGMPGVGKSYYGKMISEKLNKNFYDTDKIIEEKTKLKIVELFKNMKEKKFRKYEEDVISELGCIKDSVVAFGGGAVLSPKVRDVLEKNYFVIHLHMDIDKLERVFLSDESEIDRRPLLNNGNMKQDLDHMFESRKELYYSISDLTIYLKSDKFDENLYEIVKELTIFNNLQNSKL